MFPFLYRGSNVTRCTRAGHIRYWCGTTSNYDSDQKWGNCAPAGNNNLNYDPSLKHLLFLQDSVRMPRQNMIHWIKLFSIINYIIIVLFFALHSTKEVDFTVPDFYYIFRGMFSRGKCLLGIFTIFSSF